MVDEISQQAVDPVAKEAGGTVDRKSRRMVAILFGIVLIVAASVLGVWVYNQTALQKPLEQVLAGDPRNRVVHASAHFDGWIDTSTVVFNLRDVADDSTQADIFRVLLHYAKEQRGRQFKQVILAAYGNRKFIIPGDYFQKLGQEFDSQNPVYTMRTFAHHVTAMDGAHPFPEVEGGLLWILGQEMEQFGEFNKQWYLNDYTARHK